MVSVKTINNKLRSLLVAEGSLTKKASLNAMASGLEYAARLIVGFVVTPLLVIGLGDVGYGVWQVLGRMIGYISPATGRPTQALKWTIANHQSSADLDYKRRQVGSALMVMLLFSPLVALLGGILAWYAPIWLEVSAGYSTTVRLAAAVMVVNVIVVSLVNLPRAVLEGENLGYKRMGLSALLVVVGGGLMWLAVAFDLGLVGVAAATLASSIMIGLLFAQIVYQYVPWFGVARPSWNTIRQFTGLSGWFLLWNLIMKIMVAGDVVILGIFDSPKLVTSYSLTKYAPETVLNLVAIVIFGIAPGLGGIIGAGNLVKAARVRGEMMAFTWWITTVMGTAVLLWNRLFLELWVGGEYFPGILPLALIFLVILQFVLIRNDANIIDLTLNVQRKVMLGLLSAFLSVAIAVTLVYQFRLGIIGLTIGYLCGRLVLSVAYPWIVGRYLHIPFGSQIIATLRPILVMTSLFLGAAFLQATLKINAWLEFVPAVIISSVLIAAFAFWAGLTRTQRTALWRRINYLVR